MPQWQCSEELRKVSNFASALDIYIGMLKFYGGRFWTRAKTWRISSSSRTLFNNIGCVDSSRVNNRNVLSNNDDATTLGVLELEETTSKLLV
ncbi:hypothetical protein LIER_04193 [Lithospermum erythrorhizon]|uniref:Uncharacterized protein n=1 Tax=Lithospermum erythrorhizon TaxID=34254 RepID=A0AAV3NVW6_LITER